MFLVDGGSSDFQAASEPIRAVLDRSQAKILALKPWDERRLAYDVKGRRRGLYVLAYFDAEPNRVTEIEHDCQLDGKILRVLVLQRDRLSEEEIAAETPATSSSARARKPKPGQEEAEAGRRPQAKGEQSKDRAAEKGPVEDKSGQDEPAEGKPAPQQEGASADEGQAATDASDDLSRPADQEVRGPEGKAEAEE